MPNHPPAHRQRGIALITALLVVAIATVVAVEIAARERLDIRRTQNLIASGQAYDLARAAETWTLDILKTDLEDENNPNIDSFQDNWAQPIMIPPFEGATIGLKIEDLQGRFNINNLSRLSAPQGQLEIPLPQRRQDPDYQRFAALIDSVRAANELSTDTTTDELISAVIDWIDADSVVTNPGGAEDLVYQNRQDRRQQHRAANQWMVSTSELLQVRGFTAELVRALSPYITALPANDVSINVNTAKGEVLRAILCPNPQAGCQGLDPIIAELLKDREAPQSEPFKTVGDFLKAAGSTAQSNVNQRGLTVSSSYFAAYSEASLGPARVPLESLISRGNNGLQVLRRTRGTL